MDKRYIIPYENLNVQHNRWIRVKHDQQQSMCDNKQYVKKNEKWKKVWTHSNTKSISLWKYSFIHTYISLLSLFIISLKSYSLQYWLIQRWGIRACVCVPFIQNKRNYYIHGFPHPLIQPWSYLQKMKLTKKKQTSSKLNPLYLFFTNSSIIWSNSCLSAQKVDP